MLPDDAVALASLLGISRFPRPILSVLLHTSITFIGSADLDVKSHPNVTTIFILVIVVTSTAVENRSGHTSLKVDSLIGTSTAVEDRSGHTSLKVDSLIGTSTAVEDRSGHTSLKVDSLIGTSTAVEDRSGHTSLKVDSLIGTSTAVEDRSGHTSLKVDSLIGTSTAVEDRSGHTSLKVDSLIGTSTAVEDRSGHTSLKVDSLIGTSTAVEDRSGHTSLKVDSLIGTSTAVEDRSGHTSLKVDSLIGTSTAVEDRSGHTSLKVDSLIGTSTAVEYRSGHTSLKVDSLIGTATAVEDRSGHTSLKVDSLIGTSTAVEDRSGHTSLKVDSLIGTSTAVEDRTGHTSLKVDSLIGTSIESLTKGLDMESDWVKTWIRAIPRPWLCGQSSYVNTCTTNKLSRPYLNEQEIIRGVARATVPERLACVPPTEAIRVQSQTGSPLTFACGNRGRRCRWSAGFFRGSLVSPTLSFSPQSPSLALKTSLLRACPPPPPPREPCGMPDATSNANLQLLRDSSQSRLTRTRETPLGASLAPFLHAAPRVLYGTGREIPEKTPPDQWHSPARFPLAKNQGAICRASNLVGLGERSDHCTTATPKRVKGASLLQNQVSMEQRRNERAGGTGDPSGTIPTCENPVTWPGFEPRLTSRPPRSQASLRIFAVPTILSRKYHCIQGAAVAERLAPSSSTKTNRVQYSAESLSDFRKWEPCRTGFVGDLPFPTPFHSSSA
ncbi:hypothetical protein PR048_032216 [Dryococelus australis]|uniref:Uncharacterized protein n=1 Tax=Dryococelus australis TaxID=614101 RepID=A0ABQ9G2F8_9NEOP|nr:hypothetical protein PR048_032216 [Dryococelus australis]